MAKCARASQHSDHDQLAGCSQHAASSATLDRDQFLAGYVGSVHRKRNRALAMTPMNAASTGADLSAPKCASARGH
jgi:hypothetical protein